MKGTGSKTTKNMLLRLDPLLSERLEAVAQVEGRAVSEVVREAVNDLVERRRRDRRFLRLLDENMARHAGLLQALKDEQ